jgi:hypothetical protein
MKVLSMGTDGAYMTTIECNVRFGSKADMCAATSHVRSTPNSDRKSGLPRALNRELPPGQDG